MTTEIKTMLIILVGCVLILIGGSYLYQRSIPQPILTSHQEALVREDSIKVVAPAQKVVVVEFADYQCPACSFIAPKVKELMETYKNNVTFVYRNFPLTTIHKNAIASAQIARIAGEQGKYWEMHDTLFTNQADWESLANPTDLFIAYAERLGLATTSIRQKITSGQYVDKIQADLKDGELIGVDSTPTFFVGNIIVRGTDYVSLKKAIDDGLATAK